MGNRLPLQQGQTLHCVTSEHVVFPVIITTVADLDGGITTAVTEIPENYDATNDIIALHAHYFKNLFFKAGTPDYHTVYSDLSDAVAFALQNAQKEAKTLAKKVERNSQRIYELNKLAKEASA